MDKEQTLLEACLKWEASFAPSNIVRNGHDVDLIIAIERANAEKEFDELNPPYQAVHDAEFKECDTCRAKPGSPDLCSGCYNNRTVICALQRRVEEVEEVGKSNPITDLLAEQKETNRLLGVLIENTKSWNWEPEKFQHSSPTFFQAPVIIDPTKGPSDWPPAPPVT